MLETGCFFCGWVIKIQLGSPKYGADYFNDTYFTYIREIHDTMSPNCKRKPDDKLTLKYDSKKAF